MNFKNRDKEQMVKSDFLVPIKLMCCNLPSRQVPLGHGIAELSWQQSDSSS